MPESGKSMHYGNVALLVAVGPIRSTPCVPKFGGTDADHCDCRKSITVRMMMQSPRHVTILLGLTRCPAESGSATKSGTSDEHSNLRVKVQPTDSK